MDFYRNYWGNWPIHYRWSAEAARNGCGIRRGCGRFLPDKSPWTAEGFEEIWKIRRVYDGIGVGDAAAVLF